MKVCLWGERLVEDQNTPRKLNTRSRCAKLPTRTHDILIDRSICSDRSVGLLTAPLFSLYVFLVCCTLASTDTLLHCSYCNQRWPTLSQVLRPQHRHPTPLHNTLVALIHSIPWHSIGALSPLTNNRTYENSFFHPASRLTHRFTRYQIVATSDSSS